MLHELINAQHRIFLEQMNIISNDIFLLDEDEHTAVELQE